MSEYQLIMSIGNKDAKYRILKPSHHAGIFSYVWVILQSMYTHPNDLYYIDLRKFSTYYDLSITHTDNVWEYFFEQPHTKVCPQPEDVIDTGIWNDHPSGYCELSNVTQEKKDIYHSLIQTNLRLLPHIKEKIEQFKKDNNWEFKKILGVHCRGTDGMVKQPPELYEKEILEVEKDYDAIFLITDEETFVEYFKSRFPDKLVYRNESPKSPDASTMWTNPKNPYEAGEGAIIDAYLLSDTQFMICPTSNISTFSKYLNKNLRYLNIYLKHNIKWT